MEAKPEGAPKKAYKTPQLKLFGNVREITRAVANVSKNADGGMGLTNKTG